MPVFELTFNGFLLVFFIYAFLYMYRTAPDPLPGQIGSEVWPLIVLGVLIVLLIANIYQILRKNKGSLHFADLLTGTGVFLKSKMPRQIVLLFLYVVIMEYIGFVPATFLLCFGSVLLIGGAGIKTAPIAAILITAVIYMIFEWGLDVMLPRGYGIWRDLALMLEIF